MIQKNVNLISPLVTDSMAVNKNSKPMLRKAIDFEKLKLMLSTGTDDYVIADDGRERYKFK